MSDFFGLCKAQPLADRQRRIAYLLAKQQAINQPPTIIINNEMMIMMMMMKKRQVCLLCFVAKYAY